MLTGGFMKDKTANNSHFVTRIGSAIFLAGSLLFTHAQADTSPALSVDTSSLHVHAAPSVKQAIGPNADFLDQTGKTHNVQFFLFRCSDLGVKAGESTYPPLADVSSRMLTTFPDLLKHIPNAHEPVGKRGKTVLSRVADSLVYPSCSDEFAVAHTEVFGSSDKEQTVAFLSVPENLETANFDVLSSLPKKYYKMDIALLHPSFIEWQIKHEAGHVILDLSEEECEEETNNACNLKSEVGADKFSLINMPVNIKQLILDTRSIGVLQGSHPDHNTTPLLNTSLSKKNVSYNSYIKGSYEVVIPLREAILDRLVSVDGKPIVTDKTPAALVTAFDTCSQIQTGAFTSKPAAIASCIIEQEPRVIPAFAAQIDPQSLGTIARGYLSEYFQALKRQAKPEFYQNEITEYAASFGEIRVSKTPEI